jgi:threonine aldolase
MHAGATPAELTWKAGVDVMSFGCTKNGAMAAEAVVFFNTALVGDFRYRYKRAGQLWCKLRFLSAQIEGCEHDGTPIISFRAPRCMI